MYRQRGRSDTRRTRRRLIRHSRKYRSYGIDLRPCIHRSNNTLVTYSLTYSLKSSLSVIRKIPEYQKNPSISYFKCYLSFYSFVCFFNKQKKKNSLWNKYPKQKKIDYILSKGRTSSTLTKGRSPNQSCTLTLPLIGMVLNSPT